MRKYVPFIAAIIVVLIAGCAALGVPAADTFNKKVVSANAIIESAAETNEAVRAAGKIGKEESQKIHDQLVSIAAGIDIAREVYATNPTEATNRIDAAIVALNALNAYLGSKK